MAKADIETDSGMKISVEGTADEVAAIINHVRGRDKPVDTKSTPPEKKLKKQVKPDSSLTGLIIGLRNGGFFNSPKKITEVKKTLEQDTHFYPLSSVSTTLIRLVKKGELGRIKDGSSWAYVKR